MMSARMKTMMTATECSLIKTNASHDLLLETGHLVEALQGIPPSETEVRDKTRIGVGTVSDHTAGAPGEGATETAVKTGIMKMSDEDVTAVTVTGMEKDDVGKGKRFFFIYVFPKRKKKKPTGWRILSSRHFICRASCFFLLFTVLAVLHSFECVGLVKYILETLELCHT